MCHYFMLHLMTSNVMQHRHYSTTVTLLPKVVVFMLFHFRLWFEQFCVSGSKPTRWVPLVLCTIVLLDGCELCYLLLFHNLELNAMSVKLTWLRITCLNRWWTKSENITEYIIREHYGVYYSAWHKRQAIDDSVSALPHYGFAYSVLTLPFAS